MNEVTSNSSDEALLAMNDLITKVREITARHGKPTKAIKLSRATLLSVPLCYPAQSSFSTFYGIPIEIDNLLGVFEFEEVYD